MVNFLMKFCRLKKYKIKPKVAFIDNKVDLMYLDTIDNKKNSKYEINIKDDSDYDEKKLSHSTLCSKIFLNNIKANCDLYFLNIWDEKEQNANINSLITALDWCLDQNINIINLSIGSVRFADLDKIVDAVNKLHANGTIVVSAASNAKTLTFPAALDNTIGVMNISQSNDKKKGFYFRDNPADFINIACYTQNKSFVHANSYYHLNCSNSFATPIITAVVNDYFAKGFTQFNEVISLLKKKSLKQKPKILKNYYNKNVKATIEIPCIALIGFEKSIVSELIGKFKDKGFFGIVVSNSHKTNLSTQTISLTNIPNDKFAEQVYFYSNYCYADFVFLFLESSTIIRDFKEIDIDLFVANFDFHSHTPKFNTQTILTKENDTSERIFEKIYKEIVG